jgi:hypothetical protein
MIEDRIPIGQAAEKQGIDVVQAGQLWRWAGVSAHAISPTLVI